MYHTLSSSISFKSWVSMVCSGFGSMMIICQTYHNVNIDCFAFSNLPVMSGFRKAVSSAPSLSDTWNHPAIVNLLSSCMFADVTKLTKIITSLKYYNLLQKDLTSLGNWCEKLNLLLRKHFKMLCNMNLTIKERFPHLHSQWIHFTTQVCFKRFTQRYHK